MFENYVPPALFVTWQDQASRTIHPVGRLVRVMQPEPGYEFAYLEAVRAAEGIGFVPFAGFPDHNEVYWSRDLPPFFQNRLMPPARAEFTAQLAELGLKADAGPEAILARTNGRRATDPYELFAEFEPTEARGEWETRFFARSMRYLSHASDIDELMPGQRLLCMQDLQNPVDRDAIAFRTEHNAIVGFSPAYLVDELGPLLLKPDNVVVVSVERVNPPPAPLQHRLRCHLRVRPQDDFHAYRRGRYAPLSADALRLAPWERAAKVA